MSAINPDNQVMQNKLRMLPSKTLLYDYIKSHNKGFCDKVSHISLMDFIDKAVSQCREELIGGVKFPGNMTREFLLEHISALIVKIYEDGFKINISLREVVNATGIVLHTNLGRAPVLKKNGVDLRKHYDKQPGCEDDSGLMDYPAETGYCNLEFDIESGRRGRRDDHFKNIMKTLTGAEDAILVNNNAAALFLIAKTLCVKREIVLARGEAVEIGEGFRICELFNSAGAVIREVGATNSVNLRDYESAFNKKTAMAAKIHSSNFKIKGFVNIFNALELPAAAKKYGVISYCDSGSGMIDRKFFDNADYLDDEYSIRELINAGYDLVSFSGDKLFGSMQCGIICGRTELIARLRSNQLYRALRVSKTVISEITRTAFEYAAGNPSENILTLKLLNNTADNLKKEAEHLLESLRIEKIYDEKIVCGKILDFEILPVLSSSGGGSAPEEYLKSYGVAIRRTPDTPPEITLEALAYFMRRNNPPVIGYIDSDRYILNMRAVLKHQIEFIKEAVIKFLLSLRDKVDK